MLHSNAQTFALCYIIVLVMPCGEGGGLFSAIRRLNLSHGVNVGFYQLFIL